MKVDVNNSEEVKKLNQKIESLESKLNLVNKENTMLKKKTGNSQLNALGLNEKRQDNTGNNSVSCLHG